MSKTKQILSNWPRKKNSKNKQNAGSLCKIMFTTETFPLPVDGTQGENMPRKKESCSCRVVRTFTHVHPLTVCWYFAVGEHLSDLLLQITAGFLVEIQLLFQLLQSERRKQISPNFKCQRISIKTVHKFRFFFFKF